MSRAEGVVDVDVAQFGQRRPEGVDVPLRGLGLRDETKDTEKDFTLAVWVFVMCVSLSIRFLLPSQTEGRKKKKSHKSSRVVQMSLESHTFAADSYVLHIIRKVLLVFQSVLGRPRWSLLRM